MLRRFFLLIGWLSMASLLPKTAEAQDPEFSQFYAAPLYLNPAMAGLHYCPRIIINFRDQWPGQGLNNVYITTAASYDQHFDGLSGGIGLFFMSDRAGGGILNTNTVNGIYSYQLRINRELTVKTGMQVTYAQRTVNWDKLIFEDQIDPKTGFVDINGLPNPTAELPPGNTSASYVDFSTGSLIFNQNFFAGLSVKHLTRPNESIIGRDQVARIPIRYNFHGGAVIKLDKSLKAKSELYPNIMYTFQSVFKQLDIGSYISRSSLFAGMWYRNFTHPRFSSDALILIFGFRKDILKVSYSYDLTISQLTPGSGGSHEIALALNFCDGENFLNTKKNARPIECPQMFTF